MNYKYREIQKVIMNDSSSFSITCSTNGRKVKVSRNHINLHDKFNNDIIMITLSYDSTVSIGIGKITSSSSNYCDGSECLFSHVHCGKIDCSRSIFTKILSVDKMTLFIALYLWSRIVSKHDYTLFIIQPDSVKK